MLNQGDWSAFSLAPVACSSSLFQPRVSSSSWAAHTNWRPVSAKVEQGEPYLINPACSDMSRLRGAPVSRSRWAVTFSLPQLFTQECLSMSFTGQLLLERGCVFRCLLYESTTLGFSVGEREGESAACWETRSFCHCLCNGSHLGPHLPSWVGTGGLDAKKTWA